MYEADEYLESECDPYSYHMPSYDYDDRAYYESSRQYSQTYKIPEPVCKFLVHLHKAISEGNAYETQNLYENSFVTLTERHFKSVMWPEASDIAPLVKNAQALLAVKNNAAVKGLNQFNEDVIFLILYKELYYRHIYARVQGGPSLEQRFDSYFNYCELFNAILSAEGPIPLELPNRWLWEIIDEFIYQFQAFGHYRSMALSRKNTEDTALLQKNAKVWNVHSVLNVLHSLVDKSNINRQLEVYTSGGDPDSVAGEFGRHLLYKMLGYFSLVALLRLHSLLGDYHQAIKVLENIDLNKNSMYSRVAACQITTYYYVGFAYMMMRRYADAIRTFSNILLYIQRTRHMFQPRTYQVDQINKQTEQMYTLLAMCLVLHPQQIDESVMSYLQEKQWETMFQLQRGNLQEFENCFSFACPKFLSPVSPMYDQETSTNYHKEPYFLQLKVFMDEVQQQIMLPNIRSYMKLYTTMPISKLAAFLDMKEEDAFSTHLLCFKHKMKNMVWTKGTSGLEGEFQCGSEVDFFIDKDMVHIADTKVARRYGDFFIRQTIKFEELYNKISTLQV